MYFNTSMPVSLCPYYKHEMKSYCSSLQKNQIQQAWLHLERAHVIGQAYPLEHTYVHWRMLQFGIKIKSPKEIVGQIPRLLVGGIKSFVGKIPLGNTGGADIPPLKHLPIDAEIVEMFRKAGVCQHK